MDFYIDTHAHLYSDDFTPDRVDALHRSNEQGVQKIFMPNVDHTSIDKMLEVEERWPGQCYSMMGLHPCSVKKDFDRELYLVENWLSKRKFSAVGEIGTDLYWDKTFWEQQKEALTIQIGWAKKYSLPIVLHCRESLDPTIEIIETLQDGNLTGVFHCFNGTAEQARRISKLGFYVGIGGVVTFKKGGLEEVLPEVPIQQIVLETDSPYLAPVPHRGKRNEPSYIPLVATKISEFMKIPVAEVRDQTTKNALALFKQMV
jgi:TatD DNase family protein